MFASVDGMEPDTSSMIDEIDGYNVTHLNEEIEVFIALRCPTSPTIYLRLGVWERHIKIMSEIEFLDDRFIFITENVENVHKCGKFTDFYS